MRRSVLAAAVLAAVLPLAGCGAGPATGPAAATVAGPADEAAAAPTPLPVELRRTGGIAGLHEQVTVDPRGSWRRTARTGTSAGTLTPDQLDRLTRTAADPALAAEADRPPGTMACADGYELGLTVGATTVRWRECGPDTPAPPVAARIARLVLDYTG